MISEVIPTPKEIMKKEGFLSLPQTVCCQHPEWNAYLPTLVRGFDKIHTFPLSLGQDGILLVYDADIPAKAYSLLVSDRVVLSASDDEGILYAMATLLQAVTCKDDGLFLEKMHIRDYPDKDYRALMIDLAREWHPVATLHSYIDLCFALKVKYLHLHFIDDQRYTLPSRSFPHLTDGNCHYSFEDIAALREHANACGIILVPEFEAPGHAASLNRHYPAVFANDMETDDASLVTEEGVRITADNLICAGKIETMQGIRTLLSEIAEMFPETPYIHIGGDEANVRAWDHCSACREYMKKQGISDVYELYSDFVGRVVHEVLSLGKTPIVWEGFPQKGNDRIPRETVVVAWESYYHTADKLLDAGFRIINGSWQPLYVVPAVTARWEYSHILAWNVYNWQHWWEKSKAYPHPINVAPTENVIGAQLSVWESTYGQEISHVMENLAALSERTWTVASVTDAAAFGARLRPTLTRVGRWIENG